MWLWMNIGNSTASYVQVCKMDFGGSHEGSSCGCGGTSLQFIRVEKIQLIPKSHLAHWNLGMGQQIYTAQRLRSSHSSWRNMRTNTPAEEGRVLPWSSSSSWHHACSQLLWRRRDQQYISLVWIVTDKLVSVRNFYDVKQRCFQFLKHVVH